MAEKTAKNNHWAARFAIVLVLAAALGVSLLFEDKINALLFPGAYRQQEPGGVVTTMGGDLYLHFMDVGQGDSCIIELPDDRTILIDGADNGYGDKIVSYIKSNVRRSDGSPITYIDYAILTHPDSDHCASMDEVLYAFPAHTFYRPNVLSTRSGYTDPDKAKLSADCAKKDTLAYKNVIEAAHRYVGVEVLVTSFELDPIVPEGLNEGDPGYYSLNFYGPSSDYYKDWNDYSPVMILEYAGERFALTGDCEAAGEAEFVEKARAGEGKYSVFDENYTVSLIKLGHHGSRTSTGKGFVETVTTPQTVANIILIVSCGKDNSYGHPHPDKLTELFSEGFSPGKLYRTDEVSDIVVSVTADEETGSPVLSVGKAEVVRDTPAPNGALRWRNIALIVFAGAVVIILVSPLLTSRRRRRG